MKKKQSVIALLAACALALTACGGSSTENFADNARSSIAASTPAAAASTPAAAAPAPETASSASSEGFSLNQGEETADVQGKKTANMYLNEYFDISLEMPDANWVILNDEQLSQQLQIVQAVMDDNGVKNLMDQGGIYYDLYAVNQQTSDNINITLQKIPYGQAAAAGGSEMEKTLLEVIGVQAGTAYEQMGLQGFGYEVGTVNFRGEEKQALFMEVAILKQCAVILMEGDYFACITASSGTGEHQNLIEAFTNAN